MAGSAGHSGLQNRVAPDGSLHRTTARGLFTGNRGVIHDPGRRALTGRRWTTKSWIVCTCDWKGVRRDVWGRNGPNGHAGWTELFFLDEVTALAAGHRPCFYCRREAARAFAEAFAVGNRLTGIKAPQIDDLLHAQRRSSARDFAPLLNMPDLKRLPDGTMIQSGSGFLAMRGGQALPWDFAGYGEAIPTGQHADLPISLVTPTATVATLASGYKPRWHPSADKTRSA